MRKLITLSILFGAVSVLQADAWLYNAGSFTSIDVPGTDNYSTDANGINDAGQIVGDFTDSVGKVHGFLDDAGSFTSIDVPGAHYTWANGINDAGQIVGYFLDQSGFHGFLDDAGSFTAIDAPGAHNTQAQAINDAGQIIVTENFAGAVLYNAGSFTSIDLLGHPVDAVNGINDAGEVVGFVREANGGAHGFFGKSGSYFYTLDVPGAVGQTVAFGINNAGQIVGTTAGGYFFLDNAGSFTLFHKPGAGEMTPHGINDAGQIVGTSFISLPEPGSLFLLGSGLLGICALAFWKRHAGVKGASPMTRLPG